MAHVWRQQRILSAMRFAFCLRVPLVTSFVDCLLMLFFDCWLVFWLFFIVDCFLIVDFFLVDGFIVLFLVDCFFFLLLVFLLVDCFLLLVDCSFFSCGFSSSQPLLSFFNWLFVNYCFLLLPLLFIDYYLLHAAAHHSLLKSNLFTFMLMVVFFRQ